MAAVERRVGNTSTGCWPLYTPEARDELSHASGDSPLASWPQCGCSISAGVATAPHSSGSLHTAGSIER
jgi:hypothetical protein